MKEIVAIIRPKKVGATRDALEQKGFPSMTAEYVIGRGRQRGIAAEVNVQIKPEELALSKSGGMKYIPKRMITVVVNDSDVQTVVSEIIKVNQTGQIGDGKVFICPIEDAMRVRTGEIGESALA